MGIEIKYCELNNSYYAEERTRDYKKLSKELKKTDGQIKSLQNRVERIREFDPSFEEPIELKCLKNKYAVLTAKRNLEKRVYRIRESDLPEGISVRVLYRRPRNVSELTEEEYDSILNRLRQNVERWKARVDSANDSE